MNTYRYRQCPCTDIPAGYKLHGRRNPITGDFIIMCMEHARRHDNGEGFNLLGETNGY